MKPALVPKKIAANPFENKEAEIKMEVSKPVPKKIETNPFQN